MEFKIFLNENFFYIWLGIVALLTTLFLVQGKRALNNFGPVDLTKSIYTEYGASGYSGKGLNNGLGGARGVLHVIVTDQELITKTHIFFAFIAKRIHLLKRIPIEKIYETVLVESRFYKKLVIRYVDSDGRLKDLVISSKNNEELKRILDQQINSTTNHLR